MLRRFNCVSARDMHVSRANQRRGRVIEALSNTRSRCEEDEQDSKLNARSIETGAFRSACVSLRAYSC